MSWEEDLHPRRPDGEFAPKGTGWLRKIGDAITGRSAQRDLTHDRAALDDAAKGLPTPGEWRPTTGDGSLSRIYKQQGFDAPPEVLTHAELDQRVANGWMEMWRGVSDPAHHDQFRTGDLYPGFGVHANGTYAARELTDVADYATPPLHDDAWYDDPKVEPIQTWPTVMRMALRPDARVAVLYGPEWDAWHDEVGASQDAMYEAIDKGGLTKAEVRQAHDRHKVLEDFGRWAALKGYDAVVVPDGYLSDTGPTPWNSNIRDHYAILNRGAVAVADGPAPPPSTHPFDMIQGALFNGPGVPEYLRGAKTVTARGLGASKALRDAVQYYDDAEGKWSTLRESDVPFWNKTRAPGDRILVRKRP